MNKAFQCAVILLSFGVAAVMPAAEPAPPPGAARAPAPATPGTPAATAPTGGTPGTPPAGAKSPATPPAAQSVEPDRIEPTEKVRADSEVSFPVDI